MINIVKKNKIKYKYESVWRDHKNEKVYDSNEKLFPYPKANKKPWQNKDIFLMKLADTMTHLRRKNKFKKYSKSKRCHICGKRNISTGLFTLGNIRWEDGLYHYIKEHNIRPSDEFIDIIFRYQIDPRVVSRKKIGRFKGVTVIKENKRYLKMGRNQIFIMDALMKHGSYKRYVDEKNKSVFRYSEHFGLIDFNNNGIEKITISGKTNRVDEEDASIFQPEITIDRFDYEYIFHTHPAMPKPGGRAKTFDEDEIGILYEFPSVEDMFHFIDQYNYEKTQGSIIIAPEGMYIVRKHIPDGKKIRINEDKFFKQALTTHTDIQEDAIDEYGADFTDYTFYSEIAQNKEYINRLNKTLNRHQLHIDYYSRVRDRMGRWIIDTVYVPVYVIEPKK